MAVDAAALAGEIDAAWRAGTPIAAPPSGRGAPFDLDAAYAVEAEVVRRRRAAGHATVGRKVGFANRAMWRVLKLETLVWAHMYDDTVRFAGDGAASWSMAGRIAPRIEPEIVVRLRDTIAPGTADPAEVAAALEWIALGFEIIDCPFAGWQFQPADFVAARGLHAALVVGTPLAVTPEQAADVAAALPAIGVTLSKQGAVVDTGSGRNSLKSPLFCVAELAAAIARRLGAEPLVAGEIVSTGTLTSAQPVAAGERWSVAATGLALAPVALDVRP